MRWDVHYREKSLRGQLRGPLYVMFVAAPHGPAQRNPAGLENRLPASADHEKVH